MSDFQIYDVLHVGRERVIACFRLGDLLFDPGPSSSLPNVLKQLDGFVPKAIMCTHIHLDHTGGVGTLLREFSDAKVYVHERGANHLIDPSRLVDSASRLYGDQMDVLWGEIVPVPEANVVALEGGETVEGLAVEYTPGHASHHVSFFDPQTGRAFTGDTAGVSIQPSDLILLPTPPPDIDLVAWRDSVKKIAAWKPSSLCPTHFGEVTRVDWHLDELQKLIDWSDEMARRGDPEAFFAGIHERVMRSLDAETAKSSEQAAPFEHLWQGLERFQSKRAQRE